MFAEMSIYEIIMLLCFGAAWPFSIYKSYTSKSVAGKSGYFLVILMAGYVAGILNKLLYNYDQVIYLYILNLSMVFTDFILFQKNLKRSREAVNTGGK